MSSDVVKGNYSIIMAEIMNCLGERGGEAVLESEILQYLEDNSILNFMDYRFLAHMISLALDMLYVQGDLDQVVRYKLTKKGGEKLVGGEFDLVEKEKKS